VILKSLELMNVKCYKKLNIDFKTGKNLFVGRIGSGKSTVLESIFYSLFAKYDKGTSNLADLIRRDENKARFKLVFEHNGTEYTVERTLKREGQPDAFLWVAGRNSPIAERQSTVTNEVAHLLGVDRDTFANLVHVKQGDITKIIHDKASDRKVLFDKLLGIIDYEKTHKSCTPVLNELEFRKKRASLHIEKHQEDAEQFEDIKKSLAKIGKKYKKTRSALAEFRKTKKSLETEYEKLNENSQKLTEEKAIIQSLNRTLNGNKKKEEKLQEKVEEFCSFTNIRKLTDTKKLLANVESKQIAVKDELGELREQRDDLTDLERTITNNRKEIAGFDNQIGKLEKSISTLKEHLSSFHPEILSLPTDEWITHVDTMQKNLEQTLGESEGELDDARQLAEKYTRAKEAVDDIRDLVDESSLRVEEIQSKGKTIGGNNWRKIASENIAQLETDLESLEDDMKSLQQQRDDAKESQTEIKQRIKNLESNLKSLTGMLGKECPKCGQEVTESHAKKLSFEIQKEIDDAKKERTKSDSTLNDINSRLQNLKDERASLGDHIQLIQRLADLLDSLTPVESNLKKHKTRLKKSKDQFALLKSDYDPKLVSTLEKQAKSWQRDIQQLAGTSERIRQGVAEIGSLEELYERRKNLDAATKKLETQLESKDIDELVTKIDELEEQAEAVSKLESQVKQLSEVLEAIGKDEQLLEEHTALYDSLLVDYDAARHKKLEKEIKSLVKQIGMHEERVHDYAQDKIPTAEENLRRATEAVEYLKQADTDQKTAETYHEMMSVLKLFYREIQPYLRHRHVVNASAHSSEIFRKLIGSHEYDKIRITENHDLEISRFGKLEPMDGLSGGEQVLASLSVRIGFARALAGSDLLMLDEPTIHLDDIGRSELIETMEYLHPAKQMLIVTHDLEFERVADKMVRLRKDPNTLVSGVE